MRGTALLIGLMFAAASCGPDDTPPKEFPTPDAVRNIYGLNPDSCWRYRFTQGGNNLFATVTTSPPDTNAIAGRTIYKLSYRPESVSSPTIVDYLDPSIEGKIILLRHDEGLGASLVSKRYIDDPTPPIFATFKLDREKKVILETGDRFETQSTPTGMPIERHAWSVLSNAETAMTPAGEQQGVYKLQYNRGSNQTAVYHLVPGFGFAKFVDFAGTGHQVCAARVCDAAGTCTGADSCGNLICPP